MYAVIAVLAYACIIVFGLLVALWVGWRLEERAERHQEHRVAAPRGSRAGLISYRETGSPQGGPDHPDWPRPPW